MNGASGDVPIIGQTHRVIIGDITIVAPNTVEVKAGGLDCGNSIAYLCIVNPLKGVQWRVPFTFEQVAAIEAQCSQIPQPQE